MIEKHCMCPSTVLSLAPIFCRFFRLQMLFILFLSFVSPCHSADTLHVDWIALHVPFNFSVSCTQLSSLYIIGFHQSFNQFLSVVAGFDFIIFSTRFCVSHGFSSCFQPISSFHHLFNPLCHFVIVVHQCSTLSSYFHHLSAHFFMSSWLFFFKSAWLVIVVSARFFISPLFLMFFFNLFLHFIIVFSSCFQHFLDFLVNFASFKICLKLILPSKALCRHVCSNLCMATFLSSISACYFHKSTQLSYHQCLMCIFAVNTGTKLKIERWQGTFNCCSPAFLQYDTKDRKIGGGMLPSPCFPARAFLYLPRLLSGEN